MYATDIMGCSESSMVGGAICSCVVSGFSVLFVFVLSSLTCFQTWCFLVCVWGFVSIFLVLTLGGFFFFKQKTAYEIGQ